MSNYSKLFGAVLGGVAGILVTRFGFPAELQDPEVIGAAAVLCSALAVYFFPANKENPDA
jgi:hypothetical protein